MDIKEKILDLLEKRGVSKYKLSLAIGISPSVLDRSLSLSAQPFKSVYLLEKIADYFNIPITYFIGKETDYVTAMNELETENDQLKQIIDLMNNFFTLPILKNLNADQMELLNKYIASIRKMRKLLRNLQQENPDMFELIMKHLELSTNDINKLVEEIIIRSEKKDGGNFKELIDKYSIKIK